MKQLNMIKELLTTPKPSLNAYSKCTLTYTVVYTKPFSEVLNTVNGITSELVALDPTIGSNVVIVKHEYAPTKHTASGASVSTFELVYTATESSEGFLSQCANSGNYILLVAMQLLTAHGAFVVNASFNAYTKGTQRG